MTEDPQGQRLASLDGLRGVAAIAVVVCHAMLQYVPVAVAYYAPDPPALRVGSWWWWVLYTPVHLLMAGGEAVQIFFVLSGLVLARGMVSATAAWRGYYPQRILRIYLPVFAAVGLGYALISAYPTSWIQPTRAGAIKDLTLVAGTSGVIGPLWSLQSEMIFSLTLPVWMVVARYTRQSWPVIAAALLGLIGYLDRHHQSTGIALLPTFGLGVMLAIMWDELTAFCRRMPSILWLPFAAVTLGLILVRWIVPGWGSIDHNWLNDPLSCLGAAMCVILVAQCGVVSRTFQLGFFRWAGAISFSLYLVHWPLVAVIERTRPASDLHWAAPAAIGASLLVGTVFHLYLERPAHLLARRVGRACSRRPTLTAPVEVPQ